MTTTLVQNAHLPSNQVKILLDLLKIQSQRGCIDWCYDKIARHYGVCRDVIKRLFAYLKKFDLLDTVRQGATRFLKVIKEEVFEYLNTPLDWLNKKGLYTKKAPSLAPPLAPSLAPPFQGENSSHTYKKKNESKSTVQSENSLEEEIADAIVEHPLFVPIKSKASAHKHFKKAPAEALKNLTWLDSELAALKFPHIKQVIGELLAKHAPEEAKQFGWSGDTLTYGYAPTTQKSAIYALNWEEFLTSILKTLGKDHLAAKIISVLEAQINEAIQSDVQKYKLNRKAYANRQRIR